MGVVVQSQSVPVKSDSMLTREVERLSVQDQESSVVHDHESSVVVELSQEISEVLLAVSQIMVVVVPQGSSVQGS